MPNNIDIGVIRQRIGNVQQNFNAYNIVRSGIGTVEKIIPDTKIISKLPDSLTAATKANIVAVTRQQELSKSPVPESLEEISNKLREAETSSNIGSQLSNFKPIIVGSAVQRKKINESIEGDNSKSAKRSAAKRKILETQKFAITNQIAEKGKQLTQIGLEKTRLLERTELLEKQIANISTKMQDLINTGAGIEKIQALEAQLDKYTALYEQTKVTLEKIKKLYEGEYKVMEKLRRKRDEIEKNIFERKKQFDKNYKKFKEIPKAIKFPKLPKLPTFNIRKGNIKTQITNFINKLKTTSRQAAKVAAEKVREEAQEKIRDPKKANKFEKAASKARQALFKAREAAVSVQAVRDNIIAQTVGALDNQIKRIRFGVSKAQQEVEFGIDMAATQANLALMKAKDAKRRAEQLRDSGLAQLDAAGANLARQAAAGIKSAQNLLNKQLVTADLKSSPNLANRSVEELQKLDELSNSMTLFLNANNITNFITGVGIGSTLRSARQQSLKLDEFRKKYPDAINRGNFDSINRIGNVSGVYIVVTTYYEKTGRPIVAPFIPRITNNTVATTTPTSPTETSATPTAAANTTPAQATSAAPPATTTTAPAQATSSTPTAATPTTSAQATSTQETVPTLSSAQANGFYATSTTVMGQYGTFVVYYKGKEIVSDTGFKSKSITLDTIERRLSGKTCELAYSLLNNGKTDEWLNDPKIKNGCPNTLRGNPGGFSIGVSNVVVSPTSKPPIVPPIVTSTNTIVTSTNKVDRSKFTFVVDGGGGQSFELVAMRYDGRLLNITSWPIATRYSPNYSFNNFADGIQSVRASIQFYIDRGTFDSYVK